jgi:XTP/dITP diphosphohydrolase
MRAGGGVPLLVATRNRGKAAELQPALRALGYGVTDLGSLGIEPTPAEDAVEIYETFEQNALAKARYYARVSGGLATVADDSGLAVDALDGEPGVRSRRWSGVEGPDEAVVAANNALLLQRLATAPTRRAVFVCAIAFVAGPAEVVVRGEAPGRIAHAPRGSHGFGYDPLFEAQELDWRTFAEASAVEKERVSHRGRAISALAAALDAARRGRAR